MALPEISMRQLLEAGVHFGHQSHRWNPKMAPFLYGVRSGIHIIDLSQTVPMLFRALQAISDTVSAGGRVLFVATKRQAQEAIAEAAKNCGQYYVNRRWLGGTLTNWKTVSNSIARMKKLQEIRAGGGVGLTKRELLDVDRELEKLDKSLGGIANMNGTPHIMFAIDINKDKIAIQEAQRLGIPVVAVVDSNSSPDGITYPIPGNDDAGRAIALYCDLVSKAVLNGMERGQNASGIDIGASEAPPVEAASA